MMQDNRRICLQLANLDRTDAAERRVIDQRAERLKAALTESTYL